MFILRLRHGLALLALISFGLTTTASAASLSGALGVTGQGDAVVRADMSFKWASRWFESDRGSLTGYWDAAYTYWARGKHYRAAHSLSFSPVLVYEFNTRHSFTPYVEFGIGAALFSKTRVGEQKLGSAFNFEDRLAFGLALPGQQRVGVRAIHYSNAGLNHPNKGIESYSLFYSRAF